MNRCAPPMKAESGTAGAGLSEINKSIVLTGYCEADFSGEAPKYVSASGEIKNME